MIDHRLKTFLSLCKLMNYRKVAEKLNMTQPAVTQHIQYLEDMYDSKLFIYEQRVLKMTKEAEILKNCIQNMCYQEEKLLSLLRENKNKYYLSIGATKTIGEFVILEQITRFLDNQNNILSLSVNNTVKILNKLERGKIDFAIIEGFFDKNKFKYKLYRKESFVAICSKNHKFAKKTISFEELYTESLILREDGSGTRNILELILMEKNFSIESFARVIYSNDFKAIIHLVEKNIGITFAYKSLLDKNDNLEIFYIKDCDDIVREFNYVFFDNKISEEKIEYFETFR